MDNGYPCCQPIPRQNSRSRANWPMRRSRAAVTWPKLPCRDGFPSRLLVLPMAIGRTIFRRVAKACQGRGLCQLGNACP